MTTLRAPDKKAEARKEDDRLVPLVAQAVRDIEAAAELVGAFEDRLHQQVVWLDTHEAHPKYAERHQQAVASAQRHEDLLSALYHAGATLHRRVAHLSAEGKRRAEAATPGVTGGIDYARRRHYHHSGHAGYYYRLLADGRDQ